ncbi:metaxin [Rhyzopertha dominica]|nr:metaxin [Rhyzopertha dominica]
MASETDVTDISEELSFDPPRQTENLAINTFLNFLPTSIFDYSLTLLIRFREAVRYLRRGPLNNLNLVNVSRDESEPNGKKKFRQISQRKSSMHSSSTNAIMSVLNCSLSQEPWPKDVKLYQPYEVEQILLPDNANCLAVQAFLKMCNLDFQVEPRANAEFMSPTGRVPFIKAGAFVVSELEGIVQFVNNKGISLTSDFEPDQRSDMRAYMSLVHNVLENAELYICWCDNETYREVTKPRNGSVYPWPLNHLQTWSKRLNVVSRLKMLGWYKKTLQEVYKEVDNCCQALTDRLEGKEYFFGNNCSELDCLVYGHIKTLLTYPITCKDVDFKALVRSYKILVRHTENIDLKIMKSRVRFRTEAGDSEIYEMLKEAITACHQIYEASWRENFNPVDLLMCPPTELDALVFGHLFTILTTPLPNSRIANTVRNYPTLINLVQRIEKEYFKRDMPR